MGRKTKQKPMSRGTAPQRLIVMIDIDFCCKYCYVMVGVTIPFKGPKKGLSKIMKYFTFDYWVGKLNKSLYLVVLPHKGSLSPFRGPKRGSVKNYDIFHFGLLGTKTKQKPMSRGTAP